MAQPCLPSFILMHNVVEEKKIATVTENDGSVNRNTSKPKVVWVKSNVELIIIQKPYDYKRMYSFWLIINSALDFTRATLDLQ